jgi:hypothetical protein
MNKNIEKHHPLQIRKGKIKKGETKIKEKESAFVLRK